MQPGQSSDPHGKVPANLQREVRAKLASLNIKLTLAAEELKKTTDRDRIRELREHVVELKAEAHEAVEKYRWAQQLYAESAPMAPGREPDRGSGPAADAAFDGMLVFGDVDLTAPPPVELSSAALGKSVVPDRGSVPIADDVAVVFDLDELLAPAATHTGSGPLEDVRPVFGDVTYTLDLDAPESAELPDMEGFPARGGRLGHAFAYAVQASQTDGVALAAPMAAASLAIEGGADEDATVAAALHDVCEGSGGEERRREVAETFGPAVAGLLEWCGWMKQIDPWEHRDRSWLAHLKTAPPDAFLISICYRIATLSAIDRARRALGVEALGESDKHRERFFWCQRALLKAYRTKAGGPLVEEWQRLVDDLETGTGGRSGE